MNTKEPEQYNLKQEQIKKFIAFLGGYKYIESDKKMSGNERKGENIELVRKYSDVEFIKKELGLDLEPIYMMNYKVLKIDRMKTSDLEFSSDSSVFKIKGTDNVLKIYFHLGKQVIEKYHKIHNKIASKIYSTECQGELNGEKFDRIEFDIHKLPENNIIGTNESCISVIPEVKSGLNVSLNLLNINKIREEIVTSIVRKINEENNLKIDEDFIDPMNIAFHRIENGTLYLTITDLGTRIEDFLKYFEKEGPVDIVNGKM